MKKAWKWVLRHAAAILGGLAALVVGWLAWGAFNRRAGALKDEIELVKVERDLAVLNERKDRAVDRMGEKAAEAATLKNELRTAKKRIVEIRERAPIVEDLSDEELDSRLADLGL